ncbi:MAG: cytidylate kinase [Planctomycetaceae bacterium]|nr:cytidylate kinase [Planctomycetaceae bacterium]
MIVTLDGPAGAGKSSAARRLAQRLGFRFLDTGAMYRAVTLAGMRAGIDLADEAALAKIAAEMDLELTDERVVLNGESVTRAIRTFEVTTLTRHAADNPAVRDLLVDRQRAWAATGNVVTEGRDQATVVFPAAECKIFLTACELERARRRRADLLANGEDLTFDEVLQKQRARDAQDRDRPYGGLARTDDSIEVNTDGLTAEEVVDRLEQIVRQRQAELGPSGSPA